MEAAVTTGRIKTTGHHHKVTDPKKRFKRIAIRRCPYCDGPFRPGCCDITKAKEVTQKL